MARVRSHMSCMLYVVCDNTVSNINSDLRLWVIHINSPVYVGL